MQSYSSAVSIDIPITLRTLRKVRAIAVRNVSLEGLAEGRPGSAEVAIYVENNRVYVQTVDPFELRNGTLSICEGAVDLPVSGFVVKGFWEEEEVFSFNMNLDTDYVDVGPSLEAFSLPLKSSFMFVRLSNGVWTSNHTSLSSHIPYISPIVSHIEPRFLSYSWILDSARVVQRLHDAKRAVAGELAEAKQQLFDRHELTMKKLRRRIVLARKACDEKSRTIDRLEQAVAAMESTLFHKRNSYEARLRALENTIESNPPREIPYSTLVLLEEGRRQLGDRKLLKLKEVIPIERNQKLFTICRFPFSKFNPDIRSEELFSTALGLTVLMVSTVSVILGIPVRPKILFCSSRSSLVDMLTETELPLYYKGVEKSDYVRGVELLHDAVCELLTVSGRGEGRSSELLADIYRLLHRDRVEDIW